MSDRDVSTSSQLGSSIKNSPSSISRRSFQQERELLLSASDTSHDDSWKYGSQNAPLSVSSNRRRLKPSKKCLEITAFVLVGVVIVTIMFLPITIIHFTLGQGQQQSNQMNCGEKTWATLNNSYIAPKNYTGTVCLKQLKHLQMCATNRTMDDDVFVNVSNLPEVEGLAEIVLGKIDQLISDDSTCKQAAVPFVCLHLFPLCNVVHNTSHGDLLVASPEECNSLAERECRSEWQVAQRLGYGYLLPCKSVLQNVTNCAEGFKLINESCWASCDWKQITDPWSTILSVIQVFSALLAVISSLVFFVVSALRYRSIFRYPSIYLVFMTLGFFVVGVLALVGRISPGLFCSTGFIVSMNQSSQSSSPSTIYCILAGAAFQYFVVGSTIWWFFHVCSIFLKMTVFVTPVYKRLEFKIHIGLTVFGFIAPFPTVLNIIARNSSSLRYEVQYFPNLLLCQPSNISYWFFTTILPIDVLCGIGIALLIVIVRLLHKYQSLLSATPQGSKLHLSVPEIKLLIVLFFYAIFGSYVLFYTTIATEINGDSLFNAIKQYFTCELGGNSTECSEDYSKITTLSFPYFLFILLLLLGSVPLMNLMFAINWKYLKVKLQYLQEHVQGQGRCLKKNNNGSIQHQTNKYEAVPES